MTDRIERCCLCDEPTGRAGKYDDSIFISLPGCTLGPLCETCMHGLEEWCADNTGSAAELAALTERAEKAERERQYECNWREQAQDKLIQAERENRVLTRIQAMTEPKEDV